jgi:type VI secretion system protein ImpM
MLSWFGTPGLSPRSLHLSDAVSLQAVVDQSARALFAQSAAGRTFWWSLAADAGTTEVHCTTGLPPESYFEVLLRGVNDAQDVDVQVLEI